MSNKFTAIFKAASNEYYRITGKHLDSHPFATQLDTCDSPEAISTVLRTQAQAFSRFYKGDDNLMEWLDPTVNILSILSAMVGEGIGLLFSPAKVICTGICVLLTAARDAATSHKAVIHLFERLHFFVQRLKVYTEISLTEESTELLGKIMAQLLFILAVSTKMMAEKKMIKFLKRLMGRTNVQDALLRLDRLTQEECLMTAARTLELTHRVANVVRDVDGGVKATKSLAEAIDENVKATKALTKNIDENVTKVTKIFTEEVRESVKVVERDARSVADNVRDNRHLVDEIKWNQLKERLRTWLSPPDPSVNHNHARESQQRGTAAWLLQGDIFCGWKKNGSVLWISGNPGAGKSVLCSAIIEDINTMRKAGSTLIAYYYFDFKDSSKHDVHGMLKSLLLQLGESSGHCWDALHQLYNTCRDGSDQPSEASLAQCLKTMLKFLGQVPIFVVLDALDECPGTTGTPSAREKVLDFVEDLVLSNYPNLFMCITSRPEEDIQAVLNPLTSASSRVSLHEERGQREDIRHYIRSFVHSDRAMRRWRKEDRELVINSLSERADGMFRWVYCQLDTLRRSMPSSLRKVLNELPISLDDTYERTLQGIPREQWQHAHRLFQSLVVAIRPLRVEELAEIFAVEFDSDSVPNLVKGWRPDNSEEAVLSACSTLIAVVEDNGSKYFQFSHFSVKEFLTSDRLRTSDAGNIHQYHISLDAAHIVLARACLAVLLRLDENMDKTRLATFPLAFYAAQHWVDHAKFDSVTTQIQDAMERLFDPTKSYLASWAWIYDVDRSWVRLPIESLPEYPPKPGASALYYAVLCGFSQLAKHLIIARAEDVNTKCGYHGTALHAALFTKHLDAASVLLEYGADMNLEDRDGRIPLVMAYDCRNLEAMGLLLERGASPDVRHGSFGFLSHHASYHGRNEVIELLLHHEADLNARCSKSWTPLHWASAGGHANVARLFLGYGAEFDAQSKTGNTPLHQASRHGHLEVVEVLLEHGADLHVRGELDWTPFQMAMFMGHSEVAQLLLKYGAEEE